MTAGDDQARGLLVSGRFPELEDALCERVQELRRGRPLAPLTVVVGSSNVRTRVGDLLVRRLGAVANVSVVTLGRLAADLVAAARGAPQPTLAGLSRERLLRRLIAARGLAYFAPGPGPAALPSGGGRNLRRSARSVHRTCVSLGTDRSRPGRA